MLTGPATFEYSFTLNGQVLDPCHSGYIFRLVLGPAAAVFTLYCHCGLAPEQWWTW